MKIFSKKMADYMEALIDALLSQDGIFSYEAAAGELKMKFYPAECMHYWEIRVPIGELLNYLLDKWKGAIFQKGALVSISEVGKDIIQSMQACAVKNGTKKRRLFSVIEKHDSLATKSEDGGLNFTSEDLILVEVFAEKIKWALQNKDNLHDVKMIIFLFGSRHEYREIRKLAQGRGIEIRLVVPLEKLIVEYFKQLD